MNIIAINTGYAGLVSGTRLADFGNAIIGLCPDLAGIKTLKEGGIFIHETCLLEKMHRNAEASHPNFTARIVRVDTSGEIQFIMFGAPRDELAPPICSGSPA